MESEEDYLGGFSSSHLMMRGLMGYGIHATSKRLIGVASRSSMFTSMLGTSLAGAFAGLGGKLASKLPPEESAKKIRELDESKDFDIYKDQISSLELKKPGVFSRGHLLITPKSGRSIEVEISPGGRDYEIVRGLTKTFYPEVVKIV